MLRFSAIAALLLTTACSTIIEGRSQEISINTNPSGADCDLARNGMKIGSITNTPGSVYIEKTKYDLQITCKKHGYEPSTFINKSGSAGATWGNIVAGGGIGWAVDSATGSDNKYESPINLTLNKK